MTRRTGGWPPLGTLGALRPLQHRHGDRRGHRHDALRVDPVGAASVSLREAAFSQACQRGQHRAPLRSEFSATVARARARTATVGSARSGPRSFISTGSVEMVAPACRISRVIGFPRVQVVSHRDVKGFQWFIHLLADLEASTRPLAEGVTPSPLHGAPVPFSVAPSTS